jgi:hypothetical protein
METLVRLTHFPKQAQGQPAKPKTLTISINPASVNAKGYPEEGALLISIEDSAARMAFQLPATEAALLMQRIGSGLTLLGEQYRMIRTATPSNSGG